MWTEHLLMASGTLCLHLPRNAVLLEIFILPHLLIIKVIAIVYHNYVHYGIYEICYAQHQAFGKMRNSYYCLVKLLYFYVRMHHFVELFSTKMSGEIPSWKGDPLYHILTPARRCMPRPWLSATLFLPIYTLRSREISLLTLSST